MELLETLVFSCAYYLLCSCIPGTFGNSASIDTSVMKEKFDLIATVLFQTDWNVFFTLTFEDVCHRFGADLREMDNLMYEIFGMSGDEIIGQYREGRLDVPIQKHSGKY